MFPLWQVDLYVIAACLIMIVCFFAGLSVKIRRSDKRYMRAVHRRRRNLKAFRLPHGLECIRKEVENDHGRD